MLLKDEAVAVGVSEVHEASPRQLGHAVGLDTSLGEQSQRRIGVGDDQLHRVAGCRAPSD